MNREADQLKFDFEKATALSNIAAQISHDIRSPLSALNMVVSFVKDIPEEQRAIMRSAAQRINDIASDLLAQSKDGFLPRQLNSSLPATAGDRGVAEAKTQLNVRPRLQNPVLLSELLETLVSEKRVQFRERTDVEIRLDISQGRKLSAMINSSDFARVISNCINNSVEAKSGCVLVALGVDRDSVFVTIRDNGAGIPPDVLTRIGELGFTYGKKDDQSGSGRGVFHACKTVENSGGKFSIQSELGKGTTVTVTLPRAAAPPQLARKISFSPGFQ